MADKFTLAARLRAGETIYSGWGNLPSPLAAEVLAREGFGSVVVDTQHGLWSVNETANAVTHIRLGGAAPVVRVPVADFAMVSRALDFGAEGIIAPMINSVADAKALVAAAKYPPLGERSWGPHRSLMLAGMDVPTYLKTANTETVTLAMIETREALDNVEAIAAVDGIDALFVGPSDLSIALSNGAAQNPMMPEVDKALDHIAAVARKAGKIPGVYVVSGERGVALAKRGYRFIAVASELAFLRAGAQAQMKVIKAG